MIKIIINLLLTLTGIAYPILWLFADNQQMLFHLPWIMALLWACKGAVQQQGQRYFAWCMAFILAVVVLTRSIETMFWYPIVINVLMLSLFGGSLLRGQTVVERLARLQTPDLNEHDFWALYTGVISYCIMAIVMAGEWLVRQKVKKHYE